MRIALIALGATSAIAGACVARSQPAYNPNYLTTGALRPGEYACSLYAEVQYPEYPCQVTAASGSTDGELWLEKMAGSVRYAGRVVPIAGGYRFDGERFCPGAECNEAIAMELRATGAGFVAQGTDAMGPYTFTLRYVGEIGAMGWGGSAYGEGGYYGDDYYGGDYYGYYGGDYYGYGGDDYGYGGDDYGYGGYDDGSVEGGTDVDF